MPKKVKDIKICDSEEGYDLWAHRYDETAAYLSTFEEGELMRMIGDLDGKKLLDVGCGTGRLVRDYLNSGAHVVGLDISSEMLDLARKKYPHVEFVKGDAEKMPFEDESFDVVVSTFVIVHLKDLRYAFDEIYRVLKPGGKAIITNINQRKAPRLENQKRKDLIINSYYHIPKHVIKALEETFLTIEDEKYTYEKSVWINQILKCRKG